MTASTAGGARLLPLPWDADVLGATVARADVEGADAQAVGALLDEASRAGVRLLYLFGAPDGEGAALLAARGATLVDVRTTFVRRSAEGQPPALGPETARFDGRWPDAALRALALESGAQSRFRVDPRVPPAMFERIYETWIARSVAGEIADGVYVVRGGATPIGLVTVGEKAGRADIGLLAVAPHARGRGVGRELLRAAHRWAWERGLADEQVVTQGANAAACRLYAGDGYVIESAVPVRHWWAPDATRADGRDA